MYADTITASIKACLDETKRRREIQEKFNEENGITPETVKKEINDILASIYEADYVTVPVAERGEMYISEKDIQSSIRQLTKEMKEAARNLEFERAAELRDEIRELSQLETELGIWG
jgi:excinuclease ABC subunit B